MAFTQFPLRFGPIVSCTLLTTVLAVALPATVRAEALLLIEADTGKVLTAENATYPWYPASVTKLMTAYVTLKAVKDGRLTLDTLLTVSPNAVAQQPSKMGFNAGTQVTVDNALKMMMVKSANDMAVVLAEGVGGSIDGFSDEMNRTAQRLGMTQTSYVNPNGLPADGQITSARDLAILARAIFHDLPEYDYFMHLPAIKFGRRVTQNFNKLIGRYPGADGMKTGFICASGFNLVASATRNNKRLIAVVLGASSSAQRAVKAAQLLERGFNGGKLSWLRPSLGTVDALAPIDASPPNLRDEMCGPKRKRPAAEDADEDDVSISAETQSGVSSFAAGLQPGIKASEMLASAPAPAEPIIVYTGPTRTGAALIAADALETEKQTPKVKGKGKKGKLAAAASSDTAKPDAAKPEPKALGNSAKPLSADLKPTEKTASAKPATTAKPSSAKPANAPVTNATAKGNKDAVKSGAKPAAEKNDPQPKT